MDIQKRVIAIIINQLGKGAKGITPETNFREDLEIDSLDLFQIVNEIEDEFGVRIEDADDIVTVNDALKVIESKSNG